MLTFIHCYVNGIFTYKSTLELNRHPILCIIILSTNTKTKILFSMFLPMISDAIKTNGAFMGIENHAIMFFRRHKHLWSHQAFSSLFDQQGIGWWNASRWYYIYCNTRQLYDILYLYYTRGPFRAISLHRICDGNDYWTYACVYELRPISIHYDCSDDRSNSCLCVCAWV